MQCFSFKALDLCSMNVRGLRDNVKRKAVFLFNRSCNTDIIFLQETHSGIDDEKFWKSQWGDAIYFSHGSNYSAGVAILLNRFNGDILESTVSSEGRWIILVLKVDNLSFIICNVYGPNRMAQAKSMFSELSLELNVLKEKYKDSTVLIGGDFNDAPDDCLDRHPPRSASLSFKPASFMSDFLQLTDVWRFMNPSVIDFTWSNSNRSSQSRIDLWLMSSQSLQFVSDISHSHAPLSDHKLISLRLRGSKEKSNIRGYWKLNNNILDDKKFEEGVNLLVKDIFNRKEMNSIQKWEFFKFKIREVAIKRSKEIKKQKTDKMNCLIDQLQLLNSKNFLSEGELKLVKSLSEELDSMYVNLAKGAFIRSRAKWLEEGEKNSNYFFALEKRNRKRNNITSLHVNGVICSEPNTISNYITSFYKNLYTSKFNQVKCEAFMNHIQKFTPLISEDFKVTCEAELLCSEITDAVNSMKLKKSPGSDGLTVEFYLCFWDLIKDHLLSMYNECINRQEMTTTMKQGLITLIPKPGKDPLTIENWRPISLLNVDYKILAQAYAKRLKKNLEEIISENQNGFMAKRHISSNIRLVLDLIDYSDHINSKALMVFLDFYKAFDSIEHSFIIRTLQIFGFGDKFIKNIIMFFKNINSSVILYPRMSRRFSVSRGVRQGCPISCFLFLLVAELLFLNISCDPNIQGLVIFNREVKISQLADDTVLFLRDKSQIQIALQVTGEFSEASGLKLNINKSEILCLYKTDEQRMFNIPVKQTVKYLGIHITKDLGLRQQLNFFPKIKKAKSILNLWLQRDLSIFGRVLLSKAEGVSRFVYPAMSLFLNDALCKEINSLFINFVWKNRHHHLKKEILSLGRAEGGLEVLNFFHLNSTFKVNWLKKCLELPESLWNFIPFNIFKNVGGLRFLLSCNFTVSKLPLKLSKFYQQALLCWKLCYVHNFSPHKEILWNNGHITINNKSVYRESWIGRDIIFVTDLFEGNGDIYEYDDFLKAKGLPIKYREFVSIVKAIPTGMIALIKAHLSYQNVKLQTPSLKIDGIEIMDRKCTNKHVRKTLQGLQKISPRGKFFWDSQLTGINWRRAWLCPFQFCISNKIREVHFKILHCIYPCNKLISKFAEVDEMCTFCGNEPETILHLFCVCPLSFVFWRDVEKFIHNKTGQSVSIGPRDIITKFECTDKSAYFITNLMLLIGKFHIHKMKFSKSPPNFAIFTVELKLYLATLELMSNKKSERTLRYFKESSSVIPE